MSFRCLGIAWLLVCISNTAIAHEVRPAYLELKQTAPEIFEVRWKVPAMGDNLRLGLYVRYPDSCEMLEEPTGMFIGGAYLERLRIREPNGLVGSTIEIDVPINARSSDSPAIRSLWARAHLAAWADAEVVEQSEGGREQMVRFALSEGLVSSGTSFIAVDEDEVGGAVPAVRVNVPAAKPVGVPDEAGM